MELTNTKDALGDPIEFGKTYGYSIDSNGITTVTFGIAKKFTPKGLVSLEIIRSVSGLWFNEPTPRETTAKTVSTKSMKLFPTNL